eukprot:9093432-Pyramimonas_sp.AAC.1
MGLLRRDKHSEFTNFEWAMFFLENDGDMPVVPFVLKPEMFGFPISWGRIWFICVPMRLLREARMSREEGTKFAVSLMN